MVRPLIRNRQNSSRNLHQGTLKGILLLQRSPGAQEQQRKGRGDSLKDACRGFAAAGFARNAVSDRVTAADGDEAGCPITNQQVCNLLFVGVNNNVGSCLCFKL